MKNWIILIWITLGSLSLQAENSPAAGFRHHRIFFGGSAYNLTNHKALDHKVDEARVDQQYSAGFMLGYEYKFDKRLSLGLDIYMTGMGTSYVHKTKGSLITGYIGVSGLLKLKYSWLYRAKGKGFFRMYSGAGAGIYHTLVAFDDVVLPDIKAGNRFGYQADLLGAEISFSWFGLWLELGYGDQGNVKTGISFNFKK